MCFYPIYSIWIQLLDRRQQRLELVLLSLSNFTEVLPIYDDSTNVHLGSPIVQVIYSQESSVWINVNDLLYFLPSSDNNEVKIIMNFNHFMLLLMILVSLLYVTLLIFLLKVQFIWASEETGYRHLYLITSQIMPYMNGIAETTEAMDYVFLQPKIISKVALTSGDWEVLGWDLWVDYEKQLVYFMGLKETPLEKHLYVVSLRRPGEVRLLTRPGYSYSIDFNKVRYVD